MLIIGFLLFFQQNPLYSIIILVLLVGVYVYFKYRSSEGNTGILSFLSRKVPQHDSKTDELYTLMMLQQLFNSNHSKNIVKKEHENNNEKNYSDKIKQEILELLEMD